MTLFRFLDFIWFLRGPPGNRLRNQENSKFFKIKNFNSVNMHYFYLFSRQNAFSKIKYVKKRFFCVTSGYNTLSGCIKLVSGYIVFGFH